MLNGDLRPMQLSPSRNNPVAAVRRWISLNPGWALTLAVLLALVPFLTKPFNIYDPLFIWSARQIQSHPSDPFGFQVNWNESNDTAAPMWQVTRNPPLAGYYLAFAATVLGWSEPALH